jgi:hypothetical protein
MWVVQIESRGYHWRRTFGPFDGPQDCQRFLHKQQATDPQYFDNQFFEVEDPNEA